LFCAWLSDAVGRRPSVVFVCVMASVATSLSGYLSDAHVGTVSVFYIMVLVAGFFGGGLYAIVGPYMAEVWPSKLRSSGMGLGYGVGNLGKFIGPAGLALIAGSSNYVSPQATLHALVPGMNFFAFWYVLGALAIWFIGFETRGRTIEDIDRALTLPTALKTPAL
jgi:putative MFS transporter